MAAIPQNPSMPCINSTRATRSALCGSCAGVRPSPVALRCRPRRCAAVVAAGALTVTKPTLIDVPVSNHGARVRYVIYAKGLESEFDIVSPAAFDGLGSDTYRAINPQGKMPVLLMPDGTALPESEVIVQYILDKWGNIGPSLLAATPEARATAALAARLHDQYITPIQACMYRAMEAPQRAAQLAQLVAQLDALEGVVVGPYVTGPELTAGDAALLPTFVFLTYILPRYFGWSDVFAGRPKLAAWWERMAADSVAARVVREVQGGLEAWSSKGRWEELGISKQLQETAGEYKWVYP